MHAVVAQDERFVECRRNALGYCLSFGGGLEGVDDNGKFIAAKAGDDIVRPDAATEPVGHSFEQGVANRMPERVVDLLELIEVQHQDGDAAVPCSRGANSIVQALPEEHAVGQIRERIVRGQVSDARLGALPSVMSSVVATQAPSAIGR